MWKQNPSLASETHLCALSSLPVVWVIQVHHDPLSYDDADHTFFAVTTRWFRCPA